MKLTMRDINKMKRHKTLDWYLQNWRFAIVFLWPIIVYREITSPINKYFNKL